MLNPQVQIAVVEAPVVEVPVVEAPVVEVPVVEVPVVEVPVVEVPVVAQTNHRRNLPRKNLVQYQAKNPRLRKKTQQAIQANLHQQADPHPAARSQMLQPRNRVHQAAQLRTKVIPRNPAQKKPKRLRKRSKKFVSESLKDFWGTLHLHCPYNLETQSSHPRIAV